jgi:signal transduction histidine kinase
MTSPTDDPPTILIVDDQASNLLALEAVLDPLGYRIVRAESGPEALRRLEEHDYVLILMDVHMPGLDGYETVRLIRQREGTSDIPVIFLTAVFNQPEHTLRGYALGAVDYVSKPFEIEVLRAKVGALVKLYTRGQRTERDRSQAAERMKDLFLGAVGHDLRNPLNAILLGAQLLLRDDSNEQHRAHAKRIERAGHRMQRMIEDILELTRKEFAGGIVLSPRPTDLGDICRTVVDEHRLARPDRILQLELVGDVVGYWDPDRLARVVSNLVGNAVEHGDAGPVLVRVSDQGERVVLQVQNEGAPIEPSVRETIFEPFRRGETSASGLGLGLYIVREIVRAHQGSVELSSTHADGTIFTATLPKAVRVVAEAES